MTGTYWSTVCAPITHGLYRAMDFFAKVEDAPRKGPHIVTLTINGQDPVQ